MVQRGSDRVVAGRKHHKCLPLASMGRPVVRGLGSLHAIRCLDRNEILVGVVEGRAFAFEKKALLMHRLAILDVGDPERSHGNGCWFDPLASLACIVGGIALERDHCGVAKEKDVKESKGDVSRRILLRVEKCYEVVLYLVHL